MTKISKFQNLFNLQNTTWSPLILSSSIQTTVHSWWLFCLVEPLLLATKLKKFDWFSLSFFPFIFPPGSMLKNLQGTEGWKGYEVTVNGPFFANMLKKARNLVFLKKACVFYILSAKRSSLKLLYATTFTHYRFDVKEPPRYGRLERLRGHGKWASTKRFFSRQVIDNIIMIL